MKGTRENAGQNTRYLYKAGLHISKLSYIRLHSRPLKILDRQRYWNLAHRRIFPFVNHWHILAYRYSVFEKLAWPISNMVLVYISGGQESSIPVWHWTTLNDHCYLQYTDYSWIIVLKLVIHLHSILNQAIPISQVCDALKILYLTGTVTAQAKLSTWYTKYLRRKVNVRFTLATIYVRHDKV